MIAKFESMGFQFYRTVILLVSRGPKQRLPGTRENALRVF